MIYPRARAAAAMLLVLILGAMGGRGAGLELGCEIVPLDAAGAFAKIPAAFGASSDALLALLSEQGVPPSELADIEADFDAALTDVTTTLVGLPSFIPIPLVAGGVEIPLSLVVVDAVRVSGGVLDSAIVRGIASAAGIEIPSPLVDETFDLDGETAGLALDVDVSSWSVAMDAVKRLDIWIAALNLSAGFGYTAGGITVDVERDVPADWIRGVDSALAELHLEELRWAALTTRVGARLELGLPFLRVYAEARLVQPLVEWVGWWDLGVAGWAGTLGVVIRF